MIGRVGWFVLGVVAGLLFAHRKQLADLWHNRQAVSSGEKIVSGVGSVIEGGRALWDEVF